METLLEWARGPIFRGALAFLILGLMRHAVLTWFESVRAVQRAGDKRIPYWALAKATLQWLFPVRKVKNRLLYSITTVSFYAAILITPIFLAGHIVLIERSVGVRWWAIPNHLADFLTLIAVVTAVALVIERAMARDTRALSRFSDYVIPLLVAVPFATGFLVMHPGINPFPYNATMLAHVMSANLLFVLIPLTRPLRTVANDADPFRGGAAPAGVSGQRSGGMAGQGE
ncbi:MAG: hypothetical protein N3D11_10885 [Candidatus Sumerlaeia bacterium]|nr:hypothetical protein [Candidatus Sumerlaeia bacterium]